MTPATILSQHPIRLAELNTGVRVGYRGAGSAIETTHVLLHGIGSGSGSWAFQLQAAQRRTDLRVLAWDAPGYGQSTRLASEEPDATAYAVRLWAWLDAMGSHAEVSLVGHSLGALMAARAALLRPGRVRQLILLSPARGYGDASPVEREKKLSDRLNLLRNLGPAGMARERAAAMLSPNAPSALVEAVRDTMASIHLDGYTQAARLLDQGRLLEDLARVVCPVTVASGSADTITPPQACQTVANQVRQDRLDLGPVGHACPLEAADAVNALTGLAPQRQTTG